MLYTLLGTPNPENIFIFINLSFEGTNCKYIFFIYILYFIHYILYIYIYIIFFIYIIFYI